MTNPQNQSTAQVWRRRLAANERHRAHHDKKIRAPVRTFAGCRFDGPGTRLAIG